MRNVVVLIFLVGCGRSDPDLVASDPNARHNAFRSLGGPWVYRHYGFVQKWAEIGYSGDYVEDDRGEALEALGKMADERACASLREELDGPLADQVRTIVKRSAARYSCGMELP